MEGRKNFFLVRELFWIQPAESLLLTRAVAAQFGSIRSSLIQFDPIQSNSTGSAADIQIHIYSIYKHTCSQRRGDMDGEPCRSGFD